MSRPEYGSDLHLWPVKPEVSPLREEPEVLCLLCGAPDPVHEPTCASVHLTGARAVARSTDPGTSWEAARSITPEKLRDAQRIILDILRENGPMTDEDIWVELPDDFPASPSGARTRRSELVAMGLVRDSGRKDVLRSGRRAIVWEAV